MHSPPSLLFLVLLLLLLRLVLLQVDLTDDFVIMALFGDGQWEDKMQRLQVRGI